MHMLEFTTVEPLAGTPFFFIFYPFLTYGIFTPCLLNVSEIQFDSDNRAAFTEERLYNQYSYRRVRI